MNMKKKLVTVCLVACMAVTAVAGGTLAYFTDKEEATNTFTVGNVDITLTEEGWGNEEPIGHLVPGKTIAKDPTVTLNTGSEDAWVFVEVEIGSDFQTVMSKATGKTDFANWVNHKTGAGDAVESGVNPAWKPVEGKSTTTKLVYCYNNASVKAGTPMPALFDNVVVPDTLNLTKEDAEKVNGKKGMNIKITAKAIQTIDGVETAVAAYEALTK